VNEKRSEELLALGTRTKARRGKPRLAQRLSEILHACLADEANLSFDDEPADEHCEKTDKRHEEVNLQCSNSDDEPSYNTEDGPTNGTCGVTVET